MTAASLHFERDTNNPVVEYVIYLWKVDLLSSWMTSVHRDTHFACIVLIGRAHGVYIV